MKTKLQRRLHRRCRAIVVAKDGTKHPTRWMRLKDFAELGPDEMPAWNIVSRQAERLAERKGIEVKRIDGQFTQPKEHDQ